MPRTASTGVYAAPAGSWNPAVDTTVISSTDWNALLADLTTALSTASATTRAMWPTAGQIQDDTFSTLTSVGGTGDVITATAPLAMTAYATGQTFTFVAAAVNTTNVTINMNSIGAKAITKSGTTALAAGDIVSGSINVIRYDGTRFQLVNLNPNVAVSMQSFTGSGTYTPTTGMTYCIVHMVGGGAGGSTLASGSYGAGGGGSGEYATGVFTAANIGASQTVTIGAAGATNGGAGGTTSLGALLTAVGGAANATASTGGLGGTGGTGTGLHVAGGNGATGSTASAVPVVNGGSGGASWFGSGGRGGEGNVDAGTAGIAYGSGGGGGGFATSWTAGGVGAVGCIVIYEFR